ncbi:hypothetical protein [Streptomyces incanus]|uniref:Uncharacterized protein n=1 Tax=Streptomyces incanus TaxID=887453 RepID=A0ABW0XJR2_9ACTN
MTNHAGSQIDQHQTPGVRRTLAFALAALGMDAVQRSTLRALLPAGETKQRGPVACQRRTRGEQISTRKNKTSKAFGQTLQDFERLGWVERTPELVLVRDRPALLKHALRDQPAAPRELLDLQGALTAIKSDIRHSDALLEQRRRELRAVTSLMQAPAAGGSSVRIIHKPQLI